MNACFIGHRKIRITEDLIFSLQTVVLHLLKKGVTTFLFGSMSDFDKLSWEVVTSFKSEYPEIIRVYVRSSYQHIDELYKQYILSNYEHTYYPVKIENAGKYSYIERNCEMIDNANYCVFYYDKNYIPEINQTSKYLRVTKKNSGTKFAFEYALRKRKEIINLCQ